jgi:hypothetical protein
MNAIYTNQPIETDCFEVLKNNCRFLETEMLATLRVAHGINTVDNVELEDEFYAEEEGDEFTCGFMQVVDATTLQFIEDDLLEEGELTLDQLIETLAK